MVRVGFVRWFVNVKLVPQNGGMTRLQFDLIPQADTYHTLVKVWEGIRSKVEERNVPVVTQSVSAVELNYDLRAAKLMQYIRTLSSELADKVVNHCIGLGIVDYIGYDKSAAVYIVRTALQNAAFKNQSDNEQERVALIDLVPDMRACQVERERQRAEAHRMAAEAWAVHQAEALERRKHGDKALAVSFDLLYSMLTPAETEEAKSKYQVTVKTPSCDMVVPVHQHGLVKQYIDGKYTASYCVVFQDYSIPVGDEVLMKIALIKADPKRFFQVANKFVESNGRWYERGGRIRAAM
jgi:hypothetical protein